MSALLSDLVTRAAERDAEAPCLEYGTCVMSYSQIERCSDQVARLLIESGLAPGARVGIYTPKSEVPVLAMLGTLKAGGVYVPIDPLAPSFRAHTIAEDCGLTHLVLPADRLEQWLKERALPKNVTCILTTGASRPGLERLDGCQLVGWERHQDVPAALPPRRRGHENELAYVLYTSGSTGRPKGVMLSHRNALAFVDWAVEEFELSPRDRLSNHAPFHFDLTVFDLYAAFRAGASVTVINELVSHAPKLLFELIEDSRLTVWYSVPSALRLLLDQTEIESAPPSSLRLILFAGEEFPMPQVRRLVRALPRARYYNLYGPTETNVCTAFELGAQDLQRDALPIGKVCSGAQLTVKKEDGSEAAPGQVGELYVTGPTVLLGYWPDRRPSDTAYATGDCVAWDEDGNLRFHGRKDFMVKIRGFRIELREVELALGQHPKLSAVAVTVAEDVKLGRVLVAHVVAEDSVSVLEVKSHCAKMLPGYMVPHRVRFLDELPKTSTGKVDRVRLQGDAAIEKGRAATRDLERSRS